MKVLVAASWCLLALALPVVAMAQDARVAGAWTVNASHGGEPIPPSTLTLKEDGAKLVGVYSGGQGDIPVEASVKGNAVTIWFTIPAQDGPIAVTMKGTVEGDAMKGTADLSGQDYAEWTAKRSGSAPSTSTPGGQASNLNLTGTWTLAVETGAGSGTPTVELQQAGEKLTGHYTGQLGEAPVTGTIKGSAVEFAFDISVQGTALHVVYAGTAQAAAMKGTVKLGDLGEGTFTGTRK
jgi:hypothetical protein